MALVSRETLDQARAALAQDYFRKEASADRHEMVLHVATHLHPYHLVGEIPNTRLIYPGVPSYDLELAAARYVDLTEIVPLAEELAIGMSEQTLRHWIAKFTGECTMWFNDLYRASNLVGENGDAYRLKMGETLRYMDALGLARIDWPRIERTLPGMATKLVRLEQRPRESFFAAAGLHSAYRQVHDMLLPAGR